MGTVSKLDLMQRPGASSAITTRHLNDETRKLKEKKEDFKKKKTPKQHQTPRGSSLQHPRKMDKKEKKRGVEKTMDEKGKHRPQGG